MSAHVDLEKNSESRIYADKRERKYWNTSYKPSQHNMQESQSQLSLFTLYKTSKSFVQV
jgi:hypothetical protein